MTLAYPAASSEGKAGAERVDGVRLPNRRVELDLAARVAQLRAAVEGELIAEGKLKLFEQRAELDGELPLLDDDLAEDAAAQRDDAPLGMIGANPKDLDGRVVPNAAPEVVLGDDVRNEHLHFEVVDRGVRLGDRGGRAEAER